MALEIIEGCSWTASGGQAQLAARYAQAGSAWNIGNGLGPFGENVIKISGGNYAIFPFPSGSLATIRFGFWIYWNGAPGTAPFMTLFDGATAQCSLYINAQQKIEIRLGTTGTVQATGTRVLAPNTWYQFQLSVTISDAAGVCDLYIEGVQDINATNIDTKSSGSATCDRIGCRGSNNDTRFANIWAESGGAAADASYRRIVTLLPDGNGAVQDWAHSGGGSAYQDIDEVPPSMTDNLESATPTDVSTFTFGNLPYTPAAIYGLQISAYAQKTDGATRQIQLVARIGGTNYNGATKEVTATANDAFLTIHDQSPATASDWTAAEINGSEFGIEEIA